MLGSRLLAGSQGFNENRAPRTDNLNFCVMIKLIIFDLDGTVVDAYKAIEKSLSFTLKKFGYPIVNSSIVRRSVGWGDENFINRFVKAKDAKKALRVYRHHHKCSLRKYSKIIRDAKKILGLLKKRHFKLAIASNRPRRFSIILLDQLGLRDYFNTVVCAKTKDEIKPSPKILLRIIKRLQVKNSEAIYVGDMAIDVYAGNNAGVKTIAVLGGSCGLSELKKARPFKVIHRLLDLSFVVEKISATKRGGSPLHCLADFYKHSPSFVASAKIFGGKNS